MRRFARCTASALALSTALLLQTARADLTVVTSFDPSNNGGTCGVAVSPFTGDIYAYDCFGGAIQSYSSEGVFIASLPIYGGSANDVDLEIAPVDLTIGKTPVPSGSLLFINGETGPAEIYAIDTETGNLIATLNTAFGVSHVVGGAYHAARGTFFLVQDRVPGGADANRVAEINPVTGAVINSFLVNGGGFTVNFGDLDVSTATGHLFIVSSDEVTVAEFTPDGVFVQELSLPAGVASLSGIGINDPEGQAWVASSGGILTLLAGFPQQGPDCPADWDGNGIVNAADVGAFLTDYFADIANGTTVTDFDVNGIVNAADVGAFLTAYFAGLGPCP